MRYLRINTNDKYDQELIENPNSEISRFYLFGSDSLEEELEIMKEIPDTWNAVLIVEEDEPEHFVVKEVWEA